MHSLPTRLGNQSDSSTVGRQSESSTRVEHNVSRELLARGRHFSAPLDSSRLAIAYLNTWGLLPSPTWSAHTLPTVLSVLLYQKNPFHSSCPALVLKNVHWGDKQNNFWNSCIIWQGKAVFLQTCGKTVPKKANLADFLQTIFLHQSCKILLIGSPFPSMCYLQLNVFF